MKIVKAAQKPRLLTELCGRDPQAFAEFIEKKEAALKQMEQRARDKALLARQESLAWAS